MSTFEIHSFSPCLRVSVVSFLNDYEEFIMVDGKPDLDNIRIVLVEPKVPGNVGASARAIKNMGLSRLVLVNPWFHNHPQSRYMAHSSEDILDTAEVYESLDTAIASSVLIAGTTQRKRHGVPVFDPGQAIAEILESTKAGPVSILFGREDRGLMNEELNCCQMVVSIPSSDVQPSLNLSQAVMVIAYELFSTVCEDERPPLDYAVAEEIAVMYDHLKRSLTLLGLKQWNNGDNYMKSLRRVFSRSRLERRDVSTIHKLCGEIDKYTYRLRDELEKDKAR